jgi:hypothetical protein
VALAERIGISAKAVEKYLSNLKQTALSNKSLQTKVVIWEVVEFTGMAKTIPIVKIME